jgi:hypothetical protein
MRWCRVGWLALTWAMRWPPAAATCSNVFLTVQGVNRHEGTGEAKFAEQGLKGRDLVRLLVTVRMSQHHGRIGGKDAEEMSGLAVMEAVETTAQHLAVDRHLTPLRRAGLRVQDGGMTPEDRLHRARVHLLDDPSDRRVRRSASPRQAEDIAQPGKMDVDEGVDGPVRVRPGDDRHDGEQQDVREAIQLALSPPRILDLGQQREKRRERRLRLHGNLVRWNSACPEQSQRCRPVETPSCAHPHRISAICAIFDSLQPPSRER